MNSITDATNILTILITNQALSLINRTKLHCRSLSTMYYLQFVNVW